MKKRNKIISWDKRDILRFKILRENSNKILCITIVVSIWADFSEIKNLLCIGFHRKMYDNIDCVLQTRKNIAWK